MKQNILCRKTVLVVDDDRGISHLIALALEDEGYQVQVAGDGCEALDAVEHRMPSLILLDLTMPVLDGCGFAREFHAKYNFRIPIVVVTGDADVERRAKEIGATDWIKKPFKLETLLRVVHQHTKAA